MSRFPINIPKSKQVEKLILGKGVFERILDIFFYMIFVFPFPFASGLEFYSDLTKKKPTELSLTFFILSLCFASLMIYSIINLYSLKRINGISRGKNSSLIKQIAEKYNWNIESNNQQITIIDFSWQDSGTDWGKQMTILFDKNDILVNCISFGLHSNPSPFHWFANKRKVNKLKTEFENGIKNVLQQSV
jgi:hypothetical protein